MVATQLEKVTASIERARAKRDARLAEEKAASVGVDQIMVVPTAPRTPAPRGSGARGTLKGVVRTVKGHRGNADAPAPVRPAAVEVLPATPVVDEPPATPPEPTLVVAPDSLNEAIRRHIADGTAIKVFVKDIYSRFDDGSAEALERIDYALQMKGA